MMKLMSVAEMQAVERESDASGWTYDQMMERAGGGLADVVEKVYGEIKDGGVLGLVGSGNNGGDTLVALAQLAGQGWKASAYIVRPRAKDDPLLERFQKAGGAIHELKEDANFKLLTGLVGQHALLLDGVLGTGIRLPLKGELADALKTVQRALAELPDAPRVVAVDVPSGVDCDSGDAAPETLSADLTVTMAGVKQGLLKFPAYNKVGELALVGIGLPDGGETLKAWKKVTRFVADDAFVRSVLPKRALDAHKGTFGTALVVAGSINFTGAVLLSSEAAYRAGAGLVTACVPAPLHTVLAGMLPEVTWVLLPHEIGVIAAEAAEVVLENLGRATAILVGCGFGQEDTTARFMERLIGSTGEADLHHMGFVPTNKPEKGAQKAKLPPMVIDADGLKLLARIQNWHEILPAPAVLTPHPGEMAVLTGLPVDEIQADRVQIAERFSREWGHVVVLKGAFTVIAEPEGRTAMIPVATPALARAGTGDVLAGLVTGLRSQKIPAFEAAVAAAWIHAQAGLRAAEILGATASVLAGDVLGAVPEVIADLE
jgi:ADP-dependent NAD(P)H-hydrate dehydratase / NAD(P)H-hydrate epimerase